MTKSKLQPFVVLAMCLIVSNCLTEQSSEIHHSHSEEKEPKLGGWHVIDPQNTKQY